VILDQFARVTSLLDPATRLLRPDIMWRSARANHRRHRPDIDHQDVPSTLADSVPR
jgi:hypothetical protein